MSAGWGMLQATLRQRGTTLLWSFWVAMVIVATLMAGLARARAPLLAPVMTAAFPTIFAGWLFGSRLWLLDREASRSLAPGRQVGLWRAASAVCTIFVLVPAAALTAAGSPFALALSTLLCAGLFGVGLTMLPRFTMLVMIALFFVIKQLLGETLASLGTPAWTGLFAALAVIAFACVALRWRALQQQQGDQTGFVAPYVLGPHAMDAYRIGGPSQSALWWQDTGRGNNVVLGNAGPQQPRRALAILLGPPLAPRRWTSLLRETAILLTLFGLISVVGQQPLPRLFDTAGLVAVIVPLIVGGQSLLRARDEWRRSGPLLAEARLLPGLEPATGAWRQLLGMLLARQMVYALLASLLILGAAVLNYDGSANGLMLLLAPSWVAAIFTLLLPAVLAQRSALSALVMVCVGLVTLISVIAYAMAFGGQTDAPSPAIWLPFAGSLTAVAALLGAFGLLLLRRRGSPFVCA